jgi:hypothetical protein
MAATTGGRGYLLTTVGGDVRPFGAARFWGSSSVALPDRAITAVAPG